MGKGGCSGIAKGFLLLTNLFVLLLGITLIILGVLFNQNLGSHIDSSVSSIGVGLIVFGSGLCVFSLIGFCGAANDSICLLGTVFIN